MSMPPQDLALSANLSPAEERFERMRKRVGWYLAPMVLVVLWWIPFPGLPLPARHLFAIVSMALTLWMTEAIPLAATALLAPSLCVVAGLGSAREVFKPFADPVIFLFIGSFMMGEAMLKHGLNRRFAFTLLAMPWVGSSPARLYAAFAGITAVISMWVSNAATTAMMLPIGLSILAELGARQGVANYRATPFAAGLMLITAFAASVGGLATPSAPLRTSSESGPSSGSWATKSLSSSGCAWGFPLRSYWPVFWSGVSAGIARFRQCPYPPTAIGWRQSGPTWAVGPGRN